MLVNVSEKILLDKIINGVYNYRADFLPKDTNGYYNITRLLIELMDKNSDEIKNKIIARKRLVQLINSLDNISFNDIKKSLTSIVDLL